MTKMNVQMTLVTVRNSGKLYNPSILRVGKMSPFKLCVGCEYARLNEAYATRTHALILNADSPGYVGRTQGYAGRSVSRCKP